MALPSSFFSQFIVVHRACRTCLAIEALFAFHQFISTSSPCPISGLLESKREKGCPSFPLGTPSPCTAPTSTTSRASPLKASIRLLQTARLFPVSVRAEPERLQYGQGDEMDRLLGSVPIRQLLSTSARTPAIPRPPAQLSIYLAIGTCRVLETSDVDIWVLFARPEEAVGKTVA